MKVQLHLSHKTNLQLRLRHLNKTLQPPQTRLLQRLLMIRETPQMPYKLIKLLTLRLSQAKKLRHLNKMLQPHLTRLLPRVLMIRETPLMPYKRIKLLTLKLSQAKKLHLQM